MVAEHAGLTDERVALSEEQGLIDWRGEGDVAEVAGTGEGRKPARCAAVELSRERKRKVSFEKWTG